MKVGLKVIILKHSKFHVTVHIYIYIYIYIFIYIYIQINTLIIYLAFKKTVKNFEFVVII